MEKDIFISYRNDGCGNQFAHRLAADLSELGYSVYFNPNEARGDSFPDRLRDAVRSCKDFILVVSKGCIERLKNNDEIDWVREELLTAKANGKHIIPILVDGAQMPGSPDEMPECLRFLPDVDAIKLPDEYKNSPFAVLLGDLRSKRDGLDSYKNAFNSNPEYRVDQVFAELREQANAGSVEAMFELGMMHYYGVTAEDGTSKWDHEQATRWLKKVSESDHPLRYHADNIIARMYYNGTVPGESQSYEKAMEYIESAAPYDGYAKSQKAYMLRIGLGCKFDYHRVQEFFRDEMEAGDSMRGMGLAEFYIKYGRYEEAMEIYESMPTLTPEINYKIGILYRDGVLSDPPEPDYIQAASYFRDAADENHTYAAYEYGMLCFRPTGKFRKNFRNAQKYLQIAADGGMAEAQYVLGFMYKSGHVELDLKKAMFYLEKARAQGNSFAALELASLYQQPEVQNYQRAYECALTAAEHGVSEGMLILANLLFFGRGCEPDISKAKKYYAQAEKLGIFYASVMRQKIEAMQKG